MNVQIKVLSGHLAKESDALVGLERRVNAVVAISHATITRPGV